MTNVRFDFVHLDEAVCADLISSKRLEAVFDRTHTANVVMSRYRETGDAHISGLLESVGMTGKWGFTIQYTGDISDDWDGFSGAVDAHVNQEIAQMFVAIDGGNASVDTLIDMTATLVEAIELDAEAVSQIDFCGNAPMEVYYRPPLSFYDGDGLSDMDAASLAELAYTLIE